MRNFTVGVFMALFLGFYYSAGAADEKAVYSGKCKMCHAEDGTGNPAIAKLYNIDLLCLDLTSEKNKEKSDADIQKVVREGKGAMKAIPADKFSDDDLKAAIAYIRTLQKAKK